MTPKLYTVTYLNLFVNFCTNFVISVFIAAAFFSIWQVRRFHNLLGITNLFNSIWMQRHKRIDPLYWYKWIFMYWINWPHATTKYYTNCCSFTEIWILLFYIEMNWIKKKKKIMDNSCEKLLIFYGDCDWGNSNENTMFLINN